MIAGEATSRASRATGAREDKTETEAKELTPGDLYGFHTQWTEFEELIDAGQRGKRELIVAVRTRWGRRAAEAIKAAMKLMGMEPLRRREAMAFASEAELLVQLLETEIGKRADRSAAGASLLHLEAR